MRSAAGWDYPRLAAELIRALRGKRSQTALSRRLGYRTNILYIWEARKGAPTAAGWLALAQRVGIDVRAALTRFYRDAPTWMAECDPVSPAAVAALLRDIKGNTTLVSAAAGLRCSRYALARWLDERAEPRLPDFLQAVEVMSLRLLDFLACFTDPANLPSVREAWLQLQAARRAAYDRPWSHAILRALELKGYAGLERHRPGWIAKRLGLTLEEEKASLELLAGSGQIEQSGGKWRVRATQTVDTRLDPEAARKLKAWWFDQGTARYRQGSPGVFSYNLFGVSREDLTRLEALQRAYFQELRSIVSRSQPVEAVAVINLQLFALSGEPLHGPPEKPNQAEGPKRGSPDKQRRRPKSRA